MNEKKKIICGLLGGQEQDLLILSELHRQENIQIAFIYDNIPDVVGLEIAEILGIPRYSGFHSPPDTEILHYIVVSEPRERFREVLKRLSATKAKILTPNEALATLCRQAVPEMPPEKKIERVAYTIEDTLQALEKLFDKKELLKFLLDIAVRSARASAGSIMLYSPEAFELYIGYASGLSERVIKNTRQKLGEGIAGVVAQEKRAKLIRLQPDDILYAKDRERVNISSAISVPLLWENRLLGVLNVSSAKGERELDESDFENLKRISRRISKVLFESLKVHEMQIHYQEQSLRSNVGKLLEKPASFQEKFYLLSGYLSDLLSTETAEIYLNTHEGDWFLLGGSNKRYASHTEKVRCNKGALSRCFLEQRAIVLTESIDDEKGATGFLSSMVYYPLTLTQPLGVLIAEFSERHKLEEFLMVKESIGLEIASFISSEIRARKMKRELDTMNKVSDAAPALLNIRSVADLGNLLARIISDILECSQVSVRLKTKPEDQAYATSYFHSRGNLTKEWQDEDEELFSTLAKKKEPFIKAVLSFESKIGGQLEPYSTLFAIPILKENELKGGIIAYDKEPSDPLEEAIFTEFDKNTVNHILSLAVPVLDAIVREEPLQLDDAELSYEQLLSDNYERLLKACEREIQRSDRYHHSFTLVLFGVTALQTMFNENYTKALELVEEITRGIRTRTRKTDYLSWVGRDKFALLSLEGGKRIRFLISRVMIYLTKDLTAFGTPEIEKAGILLGQAAYPGLSRKAEDLLAEAEKDLAPFDLG